MNKNSVYLYHNDHISINHYNCCRCRWKCAPINLISNKIINHPAQPQKKYTQLILNVNIHSKSWNMNRCRRFNGWWCGMLFSRKVKGKKWKSFQLRGFMHWIQWALQCDNLSQVCVKILRWRWICLQWTFELYFYVPILNEPYYQHFDFSGSTLIDL